MATGDRCPHQNMPASCAICLGLLDDKRPPRHFVPISDKILKGNIEYVAPLVRKDLEEYYQIAKVFGVTKKTTLELFDRLVTQLKEKYDG